MTRFLPVLRICALSARQMKLVCYTPEILGYPFNFASAYAEIRARSLAYCCKNIELASELEVPLMLVNPGWGCVG